MCYSLTGKDFYFEVGISILFKQQEGIRLEENPRSSGRTPIDRFRVCRTLAKFSGSELAQDEFLRMRNQQQADSCSLLHRKECEL